MTGSELNIRTYVPSVTKILKMLKKGVQERSTQNGEALRRYVNLDKHILKADE
jgi:hypothetical protein